MRTLADVDVQENIAARIGLLHQNTRARWGVMTSVQMLAHVEGAFRMAMRTMPVAANPLPLAICWRWMTLRTPLRWPQSLPTIPELDLRHTSPPLDQFGSLSTCLINHIQEFPSLDPGKLLETHPLLGPMTRWEWMRWGYLHTDHHLRQFGC